MNDTTTMAVTTPPVKPVVDRLAPYVGGPAPTVARAYVTRVVCVTALTATELEARVNEELSLIERAGGVVKLPIAYAAYGWGPDHEVDQLSTLITYVTPTEVPA